MPGDRKKKNESSWNTEDRAEELVHKAMLRRGWVIPTTPEQVAALEAEFDEGSVELPPTLKDPYSVLGGDAKGEDRPILLPINDDICHSLARAARAEKVISPEVEERMKKDRQRAESGSPNGTK